MTIEEIKRGLDQLSTISKAIAEYLNDDGRKLIPLTNELHTNSSFINQLIKKYESNIAIGNGTLAVTKVRLDILKFIRGGGNLTFQKVQQIRDSVAEDLGGNPFQAWPIQRILLAFYFLQHKKSTTEFMEKFKKKIRLDLDLPSLGESRKNYFLGPQNFFSSDCWFYFYAKDFEGEYPFQLFFRIAEDWIEYGLYIHDNARLAQRKLKKVGVNNFDYSDLLITFREFLPIVKSNVWSEGVAFDGGLNIKPPIYSSFASDQGNKRTFEGGVNPNFILYGPPGTGKTFKTIDLSAKLFNGEVPSIDEVLKQNSVEQMYILYHFSSEL